MVKGWFTGGNSFYFLLVWLIFQYFLWRVGHEPSSFNETVLMITFSNEIKSHIMKLITKKFCWKYYKERGVRHKVLNFWEEKIILEVQSMICFYYLLWLMKHMHKLHVLPAIVTISVIKALTAVICSHWFNDVCINYFVIENGERLEYASWVLQMFLKKLLLFHDKCFSLHFFLNVDVHVFLFISVSFSSNSCFFYFLMLFICDFL